MSSDSFKVKNSLNIDPKASPTMDQNGDIAVDSSTNKLKVRLNGTTENVASEAYVDAHINDATAAHAASAIAFTPAGTIAATDAQTAIAEVATDAASALSTHEADTTNIHGIADTSDLNLKSTLTTKGDIYVATGSATIVRQGIGADNTFLKADSSQTNGLIWASVAGAALAVTAKTTTYTATTSDDVITVSTASAWTLTLYTASGNSGKTLRVIKTSSDTNELTIDPNSSETINGATTIKLKYQYDEVTLISDGTNWNIYAQIKSPTVQVFTSGTAATYTTPLGTKYIKVKMVGGGGGGGGSSATSNNNGGAGSNGGSSTFGSSLLTASNGSGAAAASSGGAGGSVTINSPAVSIVAISGGSGSNGNITQSGLDYPNPGDGANSFFGGSGKGGYPAASGGAAVTNSGAGGGGGAVTSTANLARSGSGGGAGGYLEAIIYNPSATYTYTVGAGGGAGTAGTGGNAGGAGAAGIIIVEEYYQ